MSEPVQCDLCGRFVPIEATYVVRTDVFADPSTPPIDTSESAGVGEASMADVMNELEMLSSEQLQDAVHRRFEHRLCATCQRAFLVNPLGKPRKQSVGRN